MMSYSAWSAQLFSSVQIQSLPELAIDDLGVENDIPRDIWKQSDVLSVQQLLMQLVQETLTPSERQLLINMMMSKTSVLSLSFRADVLIQLGAFHQALELINLVPPVRQTAQLLDLKVRALFLSGQIKSACDLLDKTFELNQMADKMRLACAVAQGDKTGAELIFATRLENNELDELSVLLGKNLFLNDDIQIKSEDYQMLHLHMLGAVKKGDSWQEIKLPFMYQKMISDLPTVSLSERLKFAEQTNVPALDNLYRIVKDNTPENKAVLRAKIYQKILKEKDEIVKSSLINEYLEKALSDNLFLNLAPIMRPFLDTITPSDNTKLLAFYAVQVYALSGNTDLAYPWVQLLEKSSDETSQFYALLVVPIMQKLGRGVSQNFDKALLFCQKNNNRYCDVFFERSNMYLPISDSKLVLSQKMISKQYMPFASSLIREFVAKGKLGEAILYMIRLRQLGLTFDRDIFECFSELTPKSLVHQIILERYIYL